MHNANAALRSLGKGVGRNVDEGIGKDVGKTGGEMGFMEFNELLAR
ncbi:hypothetical protein [Pandoraea captiosa]|jgi:hypothetical protein|nr:hypothetical protein [Pandoraea captiosa]